MILVPLLNPKFATVPTAKSCELRVRGTSRHAGQRIWSMITGARSAGATRLTGGNGV